MAFAVRERPTVTPRWRPSDAARAAFRHSTPRDIRDSAGSLREAPSRSPPAIRCNTLVAQDGEPRDNVGNADGDNQAQCQSCRLCEEFRAGSPRHRPTASDHRTAADRSTLDQQATPTRTLTRDEIDSPASRASNSSSLIPDPCNAGEDRLARDQASGDASRRKIRSRGRAMSRSRPAIGSLHIRGGQIRQSLECSGSFCHGRAANERRHRDTSNDNGNGRDRRDQQDRLRNDPPPLAGLQSRGGRRRSRLFTHRRTLPRSSPRRALFGSDCHHRVWPAVGLRVRRRCGCPLRTRTPTLPRAVDLD